MGASLLAVAKYIYYFFLMIKIFCTHFEKREETVNDLCNFRHKRSCATLDTLLANKNSTSRERCIKAKSYSETFNIHAVGEVVYRGKWQGKGIRYKYMQ